jgi:hypothetical protein
MRYLILLLATLVACGLSLGCGAAAGMDPMKISNGSTPPAIEMLTPNTVPVNSVPFTVAVNGSNFGTDAVVFWHGTAHLTQFVSSKQVTTLLTETDLMFTGAIPVYVRSGGFNSNTVAFDVSAQ